jgi:hypothetical protein
MQSMSDTNGYFSIDPGHFPEGCRIVWFSHDKNILSIQAGHPIDRIGGSGRYPGSEYPRQITVEEVTPWTLRQGLLLGVLNSSRRSVYVRVEPARITSDSWHRTSEPPLGSRIWTLGMVAWCSLAWAGLLILYRRTGAFKFAVAALCAAFWLAGIVLDRPFSGFGGQIDAGDDSYYTAYAQNLITGSGLFHEPARIGFGAGRVKHLHGLPGTGLFLAPAPVLESLLSGKEARREISLNGLRAMRLLSAGYSLLAMILLCGSFHLIASSGWNVGFPTLLLWGTTLPKWTFQRCIFTHSVEMFLLCGILLCIVSTYKRPARTSVKGCLLAVLVGSCSLVRGEYLLASIFIPLLLVGKLGPNRRNVGVFLAAYIAVMGLFIAIYLGFVNQISTGYGKLSSSNTQVLSRSDVQGSLIAIAENSVILFRDYLRNGGLLLASIAAGVSLAFNARNAKSGTESPFNLPAMALLAAAFFVFNAAFHTPLGMEWGHRYSLKLYPLAFWFLWLALRRIPDRFRTPAHALAILYVVACGWLNMQWFSSNMYLKDAGWWVWSDAQILLGGMHSPYGLYSVLGIVLFTVASGVGLSLSRAVRHAGAKVCIGAGALSVATMCCSSLFYNRQPNQGGLKARFYRGADFDQLACEQVLNDMPLVAGGYGLNYPCLSIWRKPHSMIAEGWMYAPASAEYGFFVEGSGGYRVLLDNNLLTANWDNTDWRGSGRHAQQFLTRGRHPIRIEFRTRSRGNDGAFRIKWCGGTIPGNSILSPPYLVH